MENVDLRLSGQSRQPKKYSYAGIEWTIQPITNTRWFTRQAQVLAKEGKALGDLQGMTVDEQATIMGRSLVGSVVLSFEPFDIETASQTTISVSFDAKTEKPGFETQGELFLASNEQIAEHLLNYALTGDNFNTGAESKVVGKSSNPSGSGVKPEIMI